MMSGICGLTSTTSLASADLRLCLESRLREKADSLGSTLYKLTWKIQITPRQRSISALVGSEHPTSDKDFSGWPTPQAFDSGSGVRAPRLKKDGNRDKMKPGSWRNDLKDAPYLIFSRPPYLNLNATPVMVTGQNQTGYTVTMGEKDQLDPAHSRWLMALPSEWDDCAPMAMRLTRK